MATCGGRTYGSAIRPFVSSLILPGHGGDGPLMSSEIWNATTAVQAEGRRGTIRSANQSASSVERHRKDHLRQDACRRAGTDQGSLTRTPRCHTSPSTSRRTSTARSRSCSWPPPSTSSVGFFRRDRPPSLLRRLYEKSVMHLSGGGQRVAIALCLSRTRTSTS